MQKAGVWPQPILPRSLYAWGRNLQGQLGQNNLTYRSSPVQVGSDTDWDTLAGGSTHSLSVKVNGTLWSWGNGGSGRTGHGDEINRSSPVQVGALTTWYQISGGADNSVAIKTDGTLWSWGSASEGKLGDNQAVVSKSSPIQIGADTNWYFLSMKNNHALAVRTNGTLWAWGRGSQGCLGRSSTANASSPVQIGALTTWSKTFTADSAECSAAIKTDGTLWMWGLGLSGQLGQNERASRSSPVQVGLLTNWAFAALTGDSCTAVKTDGTLWAWGGGSAGKLGDGTTISRSSPVQIGALTNWYTVFSGDSTIIARKTDGTLWAVGSNAGGVLGTGTSQSVDVSSPVQVGALTSWDNVGMGAFFVLATVKG